MKTGPLSDSEKEFIRSNAPKMSIVNLAKEMDRKTSGIKMFIKRNKVPHMNNYDGVDKDLRAISKKVKEELYKRHFWKFELPAQLTAQECNFFEEQWITYIVQFGGDILTSEEFELKDLIMQDVLKNRELIESKTLRSRREQYSKELSAALSVPSVSRDRDLVNSLEARIKMLAEDILQRERSFKDIVSQQDKIRKNLLKIRTQRTDDLDKAQIDFSAAVKILELDYLARQREAEQAEALRSAMDASYNDLGSYKRYANDQLDRPILNSETSLRTNDED